MQSKGSIHQWLPGFSSGDAISNYAILLQKIIKEWGFQSEIFCPGRHVGPTVKYLCREWASYPDYSSSQNTVIYHFSIGSILSERFKAIPDKKVLIYHNITPYKYFELINAEKALVLRQGREELKTLYNVPRLALADSEYNRLELEEWGYKNTKVMPPLLDFDGLGSGPQKKILKQYRDNWVNILFVGRITPNKKIEDVIKAYYYYKNTINPKSRLFIAGSFTGMEKYYLYLKALAFELSLKDIMFTGHVSLQELITYYKLADLFLCMSEHEGFCIPLVESMYFGIPVIAYNAAAVPYTLGGSGVLVYEKDFLFIAELINMVLREKEAVVDKQRKRLEDFSTKKIAGDLWKYINGLQDLLQVMR